MNDLNSLNDVLFETLRGVKDGIIDEKKASSIVQISNSIINNSKVQLGAYKLQNSNRAPEVFGLPEPKPETKTPQLSAGKEPKKKTFAEKNEMAKRDRHEAMYTYAVQLGYKNLAEAMGALTKDIFVKKFESWLQSEN